MTVCEASPGADLRRKGRVTELRPGPRRWRAVAEFAGSAIVLLALPFGVFYWANPLFTDKYPALNTLGSDYAYFSIQEQYELQFSLWHGTFPLYVPGYFGGQTASALTLGQLFHPLPHLAARLPQYWDTADPDGLNGHALQNNTVLRLLSLGITQWVLYRLIRGWGLNITLSFLCSWVTVYNMRMLGAFLYGASLENFTAFLLASAAILWAADHPTRRAGPVWIVLAMYLLVCGGHPQLMYYGLGGVLLVALISPYFLAAIRHTACSRQAALSCYRRVLPAWAAGLLAGALYTLPFYFDFVRDSTGRVDRSYEWACGYEARPWSALNGYCNPYYSDVEGASGGAAVMIVAGLVPLLLLLRPRGSRLAFFIWLLFMLFAAYAAGDTLPLHYLVWKYIPLANVFRAPGRVLLIGNFLLLLLLVWLVRCPSLEFSLRGRPRIVPAHAPLAGAALLLYVLVNCVAPDVFAPSLGVSQIRVGTGFYPAAINVIPAWGHRFVFVTGLVGLAAMAMYGLKGRLRWVVTPLLLLATVGQTTMVLRYGTWHGKGWPRSSWQYMASAKRRSLNYSLAVGCGMGSPAVARHIRHASIEPRLARLCTQYVPVGSNEAAYERLACDWPRDQLLVENFTAPAEDESPPGVPVAEPGNVFLTYNSFNKVVFDVDAACNAFFVLSFPYSSHWRAAVDGHPAPIYRVNGIEQAVLLPLGGHVVEFRYASWAATVGMAITCLTACVVAWYALGALRSRHLRIGGRVFAVLVFLALFSAWRYSLYHGTSLGTEYFWPADVDYVAPRVAC